VERPAQENPSSPQSDQLDAENIAARRAVERREAGMLISGIVDRPSWMLAGVNAVKADRYTP